jgi:hypothetical protein
MALIQTTLRSILASLEDLQRLSTPKQRCMRWITDVASEQKIDSAALIP